MPASPAAPPPQQSVNIVDTGPPKPPPAPTTEIRVSGIPSSATPQPPPEKGSAKEGLFKALRNKAGTEETDPNKAKVADKPKESPETSTSTQDEARPETHNEEESTSPDSSSPKPEAKPAPEKKDGKKPNPWKLADEYKARAAKAEQELLETKKQLVPEQDRKSWEERLQKTEARNKELEDEIRYTNYEKSSEFVKEYHKPYEDAFSRSMVDLKEVPIKDPNTGQVRTMTADDLAQLGFMSLVQAKQVVNEVSPDFAADIMAARNEIRRLWDKRQAALKDAKENGATRDQQRAEQFKQGMSQLQGQIKEQWTAVNEAALQDPVNGEYFKPREGNQDWNQRLAKGFELVDRAYSENPANPKLTPEERQSVIKRHAAVRNRAASWGPLKWENKSLRSEVEALKKRLSQYEDNTPAAGGSQTNGREAAPASAREQVFGAFRKKAGM